MDPREAIRARRAASEKRIKLVLVPVIAFSCIGMCALLVPPMARDFSDQAVIPLLTWVEANNANLFLGCTAVVIVLSVGVLKHLTDNKFPPR